MLTPPLLMKNRWSSNLGLFRVVESDKYVLPHVDAHGGMKDIKIRDYTTCEGEEEEGKKEGTTDG